MAAFKVGQNVWVRVGGRRARGKILRHHPTLDAWVVRTKRSKYDLSFMESEVSAA